MTSTATGRGAALGAKRAAKKIGIDDMSIKRLEVAIDYVIGEISSLLLRMDSEPEE